MEYQKHGIYSGAVGIPFSIPVLLALLEKLTISTYINKFAHRSFVQSILDFRLFSRNLFVHTIESRLCLIRPAGRHGEELHRDIEELR